MTALTSQRAVARRQSGVALRYMLLVLLGALFLLPFYIILRNTLMTQRQILSFDWMWLPTTPQFQNVSELFADPLVPIANSLKNSLVIAIIQTLGQLLLASMAGYGLARIPFRWSNQIFYAILITLMIPGSVTFIPTYVIIASFGWVNTLQGVLAPGLFSTFAVFLFRQFCLDFPSELEDAGRVDGLGYWGIYRYIVMPNSLNIVMALGVLAFIGSWNSFLWPLVIGQSADSWTIQVALSTFLTAQTVNLPSLFAGAAVAIAPLMLVFFLMQRYIIEGVRGTGIKG